MPASLTTISPQYHHKISQVSFPAKLLDSSARFSIFERENVDITRHVTCFSIYFSASVSSISLSLFISHVCMYIVRICHVLIDILDIMKFF